MYHLRFNGTHYDIGYKWGNRLKLHGTNILQNVPFPITEERFTFSHECIPIYEKYFPEILDEIYGIADGQEMPRENLLAILLPMYCIMPSANCSCFAVKTASGVVFGRNSDFLTATEKLNMNTKYRFANSSYAFNGNTTAFAEMEDGINEYGLAVGLTSVAPKKIKPGLNAGMLVRLFLEKCKSVKEVSTLIKTLPIAGSQTIIVADAQGEAMLIECTPTKIKTKHIDNNCHYICATNMFNLSKMHQHNNLPEDTWQAEERYKTMVQYFKNTHDVITVKQAQLLLSGTEGFMCQYDRKTGKDTVWSIIYDLGNNTIYRCEGNPSRKNFNLVQF